MSRFIAHASAQAGPASIDSHTTTHTHIHTQGKYFSLSLWLPTNDIHQGRSSPDAFLKASGLRLCVLSFVCAPQHRRPLFQCAFSTGTACYLGKKVGPRDNVGVVNGAAIRPKWRIGVEVASIQPQPLHANLLPVKDGKKNPSQ